MILEVSYSNPTEVIEDFLYDANRKLPVELVAKAKDMRFYLSQALLESNAKLELLDYDISDIEGIDEDDEMSLQISDNAITLYPLILYSNERGRQKLYSGDGCIRYVLSECDEYFFDDKDAIGVFKIMMEGK